MEIRVTDKKLLKLTGGIVQGMSGSPIIQNDKIVGAVTHVLLMTRQEVMEFLLRRCWCSKKNRICCQKPKLGVER